MVLMIDNYDSFTFNIVQYLIELGAEVKVIGNDTPLKDALKLKPERIVISPGPRTPEQSGICMPIIENFVGKTPILGVCLGHQCIAQFFGGTITQSQDIMHGKTSQIHHINKGVFSGLESPFTAMRYHSLILPLEHLPECLEVTAWTKGLDGECSEVMGIKHKSLAVEGVQFHPESILSECGHALLKNFLTQQRPNRTTHK